MSDTTIDTPSVIAKFPRTVKHQQRRVKALARFKFDQTKADNTTYMAVKNLELATLKSRLNKS